MCCAAEPALSLTPEARDKVIEKSSTIWAHSHDKKRRASTFLKISRKNGKHRIQQVPKKGALPPVSPMQCSTSTTAITRDMIPPPPASCDQSSFRLGLRRIREMRLAACCWPPYTWRVSNMYHRNISLSTQASSATLDVRYVRQR